MKKIKWLPITVRVRKKISEEALAALPKDPKKQLSTDEESAEFFRKEYGQTVSDTLQTGANTKRDHLRLDIESSLRTILKHHPQAVGSSTLYIVLHMLCSIKGPKRGSQIFAKWRLMHLPVDSACYSVLMSYQKGVKADKFYRQSINDGLIPDDTFLHAYLTSQRGKGFDKGSKIYTKILQKTPKTALLLLQTSRNNSEFNKAMASTGVTKQQVMTSPALLKALADCGRVQSEVEKIMNHYSKLTGEPIDVSWWVRVLIASYRESHAACWKRHGSWNRFEGAWEVLTSRGGETVIPTAAFIYAMRGASSAAKHCDPSMSSSILLFAEKALARSRATLQHCDARLWTAMFSIYKTYSLPHRALRLGRRQAVSLVRPTKQLLKAFVSSTAAPVKGGLQMVPIPPIAPRREKKRYSVPLHNGPPPLEVVRVDGSMLPWIPGERPS
eukprot:TRINITY_DN17608_c0_g1_i1.p1 TRINITY_DN17608_c0_g1~~TRINITY_DN17608_c0_g1_i1.p1  ORF type:complete len:442 (+),score=60.55 TRINITY_DN17608_c0_g1_i1:25-1350(+)